MAQMMKIEPFNARYLNGQDAEVAASRFEIRRRPQRRVTGLIEGLARRHLLRVAGARLRLRPDPSFVGKTVIGVNTGLAFKSELKLRSRIVAEHGAAGIALKMLKFLCTSVGMKAEPVCLRANAAQN